MTRALNRTAARPGHSHARWMLVLAAALSAAVLSGCGPRSAGTSGRLVIASFYPLYEFAQRIGGDRVTVRSLVPAGVEAHNYEPTPQDVAQLQRAVLLVHNGAGLEPWLEKLLPEVPAAVTRVNATEGLDLRKVVSRGGAAQGAGSVDPHVWIDPVLAQHQATRILEGLVRADPEGRGVYEAGAAELQRELQSLHEQFNQTLASCTRREFITSHAAFGYLAARYHLRQIAITGLNPEAEPSPARLAEVVGEARRTGAQVIYVESLANPRIVEAVAREVGARIRVLNPIEGLTPQEQKEGKTYFTVMYENLRNLAEGLDCRP